MSQRAEQVLADVAARQRQGGAPVVPARGGPDFLMDRVGLDRQERVYWEVLLMMNGSRTQTAARLGIDDATCVAHEQAIEDKLRAAYARSRPETIMDDEEGI